MEGARIQQMADFCEWSQITKNVGDEWAFIDKDKVQSVVTANYGDDWQVVKCVPYMDTSRRSLWYNQSPLSVMFLVNAREAIVAVVFQGTQTPTFDDRASLQTWLQRLVSAGYRYNFPDEPYNGELVNLEFYAGFENGHGYLDDALASLSLSGDFEIMIAGHGVGGALAYFTYVEFLERFAAGNFPPQPSVPGQQPAKVTAIRHLTFSAPPVGNQAFQQGVYKLSLAVSKSGVTCGGAQVQYPRELKEIFGGISNYLLGLKGDFVPVMTDFAMAPQLPGFPQMSMGPFGPLQSPYVTSPWTDYPGLYGIAGYTYFYTTYQGLRRSAPSWQNASKLGVFVKTQCKYQLTLTLQVTSDEGGPTTIAQTGLSQPGMSTMLEVPILPNMRPSAHPRFTLSAVSVDGDDATEIIGTVLALYFDEVVVKHLIPPVGLGKADTVFELPQ